MTLDEKIVNITQMETNIDTAEEIIADIELAIEAIDDLNVYACENSNTYRGEARSAILSYITHLSNHVINLKACLEQGRNYMMICKQKAIDLDAELASLYNSSSVVQMEEK